MSNNEQKYKEAIETAIHQCGSGDYFDAQEISRGLEKALPVLVPHAALKRFGNTANYMMR